MFWIMIWLGIVAFVLMTIVILEKLEKTEKRVTNRILMIGGVGLAALYAFAFLFNSLFHSIEIGKISWGGITWLGGVLGAFPLMLLLIHFFCPRVKGNALFYFNLLIPAIALGHAFGRIGCFCGGCCYGGITDSVFGVSFPPYSAAANAQASAGLIALGEWSLPVYPTQLFEAVFELCIFAVCLIFYKKLRKHFLKIYCFGYGTFRFLIEFLRGDNRGSTGFALSPSQVMSIVLILLCVLLILYEQRIIFKQLHDKMKGYREENVLYGVNIRADVEFALKRLKSLREDGAITDSEYENIQTLLQDRIKAKPAEISDELNESDLSSETKG